VTCDFDGDGRALASGTALGKEVFADRIFAEDVLPRAVLDKGFGEGLRGFAEILGPSAKQPAPVVCIQYNLSLACIAIKCQK
jgi:hypothetical protein